MQIKIPEKLKVDGINFVLIEAKGKKPFEKDWQKKKVKFDNPNLINHLKNGGNYGVRGGGIKNLIIVDFDNEKVQIDALKKLPETFTVKTGGGLLHKYYISNASNSFKIFSENMDTFADVQGEGKQVVGAGSIHPSGNSYELVDDREIAFIDYSELKAIILSYDQKPKKEEIVFKKPKEFETDNFVDYVQRSVGMDQVLREFGVDTSKNPTNCSLHGSKGGKCLGFNYETAHCFHCDGAWNVFSFVMENKNCDFKEALKIVCEIGGMEKEYEDNRKKWIQEQLKKDNHQEESILAEYVILTSGKERDWGRASELIVQHILSKMHLHTTKNDLKSEVWIYQDGIYIPHGRSEIKDFMRNLLGVFYSQYIYGLVINKIEPDTFINTEDFFNSNHKYEVPVQNGILNIRTRELEDFDPTKVFFNKLNVKYDPSKKCPSIEKFLSDVFATNEDKQLFCEFAGFGLIKEYVFEKAMMFLGNGRNGKDKTLELLKRMINVDNCSAVTLDDLQRDQYSVSGLFGKMLNIAGDIGNRDLKDTSNFKALTGRSLLTANRKFLDRLKFVNYAKMIFACNELPTVYDNSVGFWDRWILIEFPYTFVTQKEYDEAIEKNNLKVRDEQIIEKIITEDELSGFLNKLLDNLDNLLKNRNFTYSNNADEVKTIWIRKSSSITAFCMDNIIEDGLGVISKKELRKRYLAYCKLHRIPQQTDKVIIGILQELYGAIDDRKVLFGSMDQEWVWKGISFKIKDLGIKKCK